MLAGRGLSGAPIRIKNIPRPSGDEKPKTSGQNENSNKTPEQVCAPWTPGICTLARRAAVKSVSYTHLTLPTKA